MRSNLGVDACLGCMRADRNRNAVQRSEFGGESREHWTLQPKRGGYESGDRITNRWWCCSFVCVTWFGFLAPFGGRLGLADFVRLRKRCRFMSENALTFVLILPLFYLVYFRSRFIWLFWHIFYPANKSNGVHSFANKKIAISILQWNTQKSLTIRVFICF